jgi:general secretion pathway protein D
MDRASPLEQKLDRIVLPNVSFTHVELGRVASALSAASEQFDSTDIGQKGVNVVLIWHCGTFRCGGCSTW